MHVALVRQRYSAHGGAERFIERARGALSEQGVAVTVLAREWTGDPGTVVRCDPFHVGRLWRDWSFARAVCREVSRRRFDLVQSHERIACCDLYRAGDGVHAQWLHNRRAILSRLGRVGRALNPYHRYVLGAERRLFESPRLRAVICNSRMVRDEIQRGFRVNPGKLHVIYNGVDLEHFHPRAREALRGKTRAELGCHPRDTLFLFVGSGFARKGLDAALAAAKNESFWLLVVGRDREEPRFRDLSRKLNLENRVRFLGGKEDVRS